MNAPFKPDTALGSPGLPRKAPADLTITVRDRRFGRDKDKKAERWWLGGDPIGTAWHNALSATFPRGEAFFIEAVKANREGADPRLEAEIRAFVRQEINHTREHIAFNRVAKDAGYDLDAIDRKVAERLKQINDRAPILNLAATMALEHFTAMIAHELLGTPKHLAGGGEPGELWRWHSVEEIEHKGVAYDTWLHATRDWSRWKRWKIKSLMMLVVTSNFLGHRIDDTCNLLAQDGLTGWKWKARVYWYLFGTPGMLRRIFPAWCAFFLPGFHPWNHDDRALIGKYESEFAAAVMA
jgi:predicted metal-dependent hydrolase